MAWNNLISVIILDSEFATCMDTAYSKMAAPNETYGRNSPKPVFVLVKDIPTTNNPLTGEQMYISLMKTVQSEKIAGIQRIGALWRLYLSEREDRVKLIVNGLCIHGVNVPVHDQNPYTKAKDEYMTRVLIKDLPLSVGDEVIKSKLESMKCTIRGDITRQQLRVGGRLTNCLNGDRIVYIDPPSKPLPRFLVIGNIFRTRVFHAGQPEKRETAAVVCSKCLDPGHHASTCLNPVKCRSCKQPGHYSHSCPATLTTQGRDHGRDRDAVSRPPAVKITSDSSAGTTKHDGLRNTAAMPEEDSSSENNAQRNQVNITGIPQDDVNTRVRQPRQADISDFLRSKVSKTGSAQQSYDLRSKQSGTNDDDDEVFSTCDSSSSEDERSPLSPETPVKNKHGKKAAKRKNKGNNTSKKR